MKNIFASHSYKYFNSGFKPIPLYGKRPIIKEWTSIEITEEVLDKWNSNFPDANIGILTGAESGVVCIDIDKEESIILCPASPLVKKGAKGETRFFKYNGEIAQKFHAQGIEILSDGNQTVMPPSIHPGTNSPYVWLSEVYEDLPEIPKEFIEKLQNSSGNSAKSTIRQSDGSRCNHGSHDTLSAILKAMISRGCSLNEVVLELLKEDEKLNNNVSYFICPSRAEWKTRDKNFNCTQFVMEAMQRSLKKGEISKVNLDEPTKLIIKESTEESKIDYKKEKLPKFMGEMQTAFEWIYHSSNVPRTRFSACSTIALFSALCGNRFSCMGFHPNTYTMIVAPSGSGKDTPLRAPYQVLTAAGYDDLIGGSPGSDSGMISGLEKTPTRLYQYDEASTFLGGMNAKNTPHLENIANIGAELYSCAGKMFAGKRLRGEILGKCISPSISIICATTPEDFKVNFNVRLIDKGIGGRFLFFIDDEPRKNIISMPLEIPKSLLDFARYARSKPDIFDMPMSDKALELYNEQNDYFFNQVQKHKDSAHVPMLRRSCEMIMKMAIMCSVGCYSMKVDDEHMEWAVKWYHSYLSALEVFLQNNLVSSHNELILNQLEMVILSAGSNGMTKSDLLRHKYFRGMKAKELDYMLDTSIQRDMIIVGTRKTSTKEVKTFFHHLVAAKS